VLATSQKHSVGDNSLKSMITGMHMRLICWIKGFLFLKVYNQNRPMRLDHRLYHRLTKHLPVCGFYYFAWLSRYSRLFEEVKEMGKILSVCPACGCGCRLSREGGRGVP
jgi:hypothetical protein